MFHVPCHFTSSAAFPLASWLVVKCQGRNGFQQQLLGAGAGRWREVSVGLANSRWEARGLTYLFAFYSKALFRSSGWLWFSGQGWPRPPRVAQGSPFGHGGDPRRTRSAPSQRGVSGLHFNRGSSRGLHGGTKSRSTCAGAPRDAPVAQSTKCYECPWNVWLERRHRITWNSSAGRFFSCISCLLVKRRKPSTKQAHGRSSTAGFRARLPLWQLVLPQSSCWRGTGTAPAQRNPQRLQPCAEDDRGSVCQIPPFCTLSAPAFCVCWYGREQSTAHPLVISAGEKCCTVAGAIDLSNVLLKLWLGWRFLFQA